MMAQVESSKCMAYAYYQNKNYKEAISLIKDSVKIKDLGSYSIMANCYFELKDYKNALDCYLKANGLDKRGFNDKIAICYAQLADKNNSIEYLKKSIQLTGKPLLSELDVLTGLLNADLQALYNNGEKQLSEAKEAIENKDYDRAIQILDSPEKGIDKSQYYFFRSLAFFNNGSIKQAVVDMKQAIKQNLDLKKEVYFKDLCFASNDSIEYFSYIIYQSSDYDLDLLLEQINACFALKKENRAQELISQVEPICLKFDNYSRKLISIYKKNGDYLSALKTINSLINANKADYKLLNERGELFLEAKMYKEAKHDFSMSLDICPSQANAYYHRGTARLALGEQDGAESDWKNAKSLGYFKQ